MITIDCSALNVVIVGGTSGINRGIAELFASQGASVVVASRSQDKVDDTVAALTELGAKKALGFAADVRDYDALEQGLKATAQVLGGFDVVVSGAAGNFPALVNGMSPNAFKSVIDIDLLGTFHVMRAVYPLLNKPGASVINISAPQAQMPMIAQAHVCAAKAGVDMITRNLANEWGPSGVRVNSIIPGPIAGTEGMARLAPTPAAIKACENSVPLKRFGEPSDIANACVFLSSPLAGYINGAIIPVDGGWLHGGMAVVADGIGKMMFPQQ
ncbi:SDR family oxidoreductase [Marinagarivorans algicola]|uniref:SDR family oxidoreductase n=1 Tax=Marinagarivorans algicola TaxID=1513270 RepID=UPI0006B4C5FF|nr:SDR family oxidoreductase [Marinagarivorans algicola]